MRRPVTTMPARLPGSYLLVLELDHAATLRVGRLGSQRFAAGWYVYVGSALGGLVQRVARHLRASPVRRWHLDYLRAVAGVREVHLLPSVRRQECELAAALAALPGASLPVLGFGASDCRCRAHLVYFAAQPDLGMLTASRRLAAGQRMG
ncbi:MAG: GIY-YIG nuclease family protein [Chloroflexi bacterium]|nr:GIY-YIG nuclease family protein [Chloroflexota bacterium]